jgi:MFS family permease
MIGSMIGNLFLWKRLTHNYITMMQLSFLLMILVFFIALYASDSWQYVILFLIFGIARDGFRNADMNLIIEIAPQEKRPVYVAIQSTLTSIGLFFAIPGGFILKTYGYDILYIITIFLILLGLYFTKKLKQLLDSQPL